MYCILHGDLPPCHQLWIHHIFIIFWWIYECELFNNLYWLNYFGQRLNVKDRRGWYCLKQTFFLNFSLAPHPDFVCVCAWRQPNKSLYLLPWLFFLITAFFIFIQPSIFPAEATHACTHRKKSPQCTLICLLLQIERQHLLINLQSATVDPLPMCSVKTCNCEIYPVQVSLALPPPAPQGQSPAPCLHCWQVSKHWLLAAAVHGAGTKERAGMIASNQAHISNSSLKSHACAAWRPKTPIRHSTEISSVCDGLPVFCWLYRKFFILLCVVNPTTCLL